MNFRWCGLSSPVFSLSGVPKGTATLQFHMVDLGAANHNHGGGSVPYKGQASVACGALNNYSPPSPPGGSHSYQITVMAFGPGNSSLGTATGSFPRNRRCSWAAVYTVTPIPLKSTENIRSY